MSKVIRVSDDVYFSLQEIAAQLGVKVTRVATSYLRQGIEGNRERCRQCAYYQKQGTLTSKSGKAYEVGSCSAGTEDKLVWSSQGICPVYWEAK